MNDLKQRILSQTQADLDEIEKALRENLNPHLDLVAEVANHILFSGGKRLRPLLMVLSARLCDYQGQFDKTFSIIFEYLHAATLLHDDLVDGARMRRGKTAAHRVWDNSTAVLVGDFLLARALSISARAQKVEVIQIVSEITENMSQGEIHQLMRKGHIDITEAEYMEVIRRKTAVLFQGACRVSAVLAEAPQEKQAALSDYGHHLGLAFQMVDDMLDYTAESSELGKQVGADLREGKITLPIIHLLQNGGKKEKSFVIELIKNPEFDAKAFAHLVDLIRRTGGIGYTKDLASRHIRLAKTGLAVFDDSQTRRILMDVADYALERNM